MMKTATVFFLVALWLGPSVLQGQTALPPGDYERLLLPITVINAPGAFGTLWTTDVWVPPDQSVFPSFGPSACDPPCPDAGGPPGGASYQLGFFRTHPNETSGSLLYALRRGSAPSRVSLRLRDASGLTHWPPVQLPVVHEGEFTNGPTHVLGIPLSADTRATARIYGIDPEQLGNVEIRVFREDTPAQTLLLDEIIPLTVTQQTYAAGPYHAEIRPPYAQLPLDSLRSTGATLVRLEVVPLTPLLRIWAFVSITDNVTQQVALRTP